MPPSHRRRPARHRRRRASAAPSEAPPSAAPSDTPVAIPSFAFPSADKELEALLPDTLCGDKAQKLSMGGAVFDNAADPSFVAVLRKVGKTTADVSLAIAADNGFGKLHRRASSGSRAPTARRSRTPSWRRP